MKYACTGNGSRALDGDSTNQQHTGRGTMPNQGLQESTAGEGRLVCDVNPASSVFVLGGGCTVSSAEGQLQHC